MICAAVRDSRQPSVNAAPETDVTHCPPRTSVILVQPASLLAVFGALHKSPALERIADQRTHHLSMAVTDAASSLLNVSDFPIRFVAHPCLRRSHGQLAAYTDLQTALISHFGWTEVDKVDTAEGLIIAY
jgi:hypothetical protein